jgi:tight adherence protein C
VSDAHSLANLATAACTVGAALMSYSLARIKPLARPELGPRGRERGRALDESACFALLEPTVRWVGALVAITPHGRVRTWLEVKLLQAGDFRGLSSDECLAMAAMGAATGAVAGGVCRAWLGVGFGWQAFAIALGGLLPLSQLHAEFMARRRRIARGLPAAIDLLSLCVGAGLDLVSALELLVRELGEAGNPLAPELERVLQELALGRTRREALTTLAARVPVPAMGEFTGALIQAELKGTPLAEAVEIKARMMRMHRSVAAEEAAARASVLLVLPMLLLLGSVMLVMLGPFIVNGLGF